MSERSEAVEQPAVRDVSAGYSVEAGAASAEVVPAGYKRTEVGVIPEDWSVVELGELARFTTGPFGTALHKADYINGGIPLINPMHIVDSRLSPDSETSVSEDAARRLSPYRMRASDIVIGRRGDMGRCAVVGEDQAGWLCGTGSLIIRCADRTNAIFVQRILTTERVIAAIEDSSVGSTMTNLNQGALSRLKIQLPSVPERHAIATALSDADALIESLDRLIAKKRAIKQAAMQQLLTGQTRLPGFTGEWETKRLGEIGRFRGGSGFPTTFQGQTSGQFPFFKVSDMNNEGNETFMESANNYISEEVRKQLGAIAFPAKSIVFAKVGAAVFLERKKILTRPSCLDNNMAGLSLEGAAADFRFVHYVLSSITLGNLVSTTALPSLNSKVLASIECRLPSLKEQQAIATALSDMDAEIEALERRRDKARQIKQGMMQELLTGRVRLVKPEAAA